MNQLTVNEAGRLAALEDTIRAGLDTFIAVGNALQEIRDTKLYRAGFPTFEEYCARRWGMKRQRAYQLMEAAQVVENLSTIVDILPINEAQTRPLAKLEPDEQRAAWQQVVETAPDGRITAGHVEKVVIERDREQEHERNLRALEDAAGSPAAAADLLEMAEAEQLLAAASHLFRRIIEAESVTGLRELVELLEDFELDRPK